MDTASFQKPAAALLERCRKFGIKIVTAESCTGGMIAAAFTDIAGSSDVFERGFVTYSNEAKAEMLGVESDLIESRGAVSEAVARAMVEGAIANSRANLGIAVTGVAGPGGGTTEKPVGLVHLAAGLEGQPVLHREIRLGDLSRQEIRHETVMVAFSLLNEILDQADGVSIP